MNETHDLLERVGERFAFPAHAFEDLQRRRDRKRRNQRITAGAVGLVVFAAAVGIATLGGPFDRTQPPASSGPTVASVPTPQRSGIPDIPPFQEQPAYRRLSRTADGVPFSFKVPTVGWDAKGDISINKSIVGPQGAEAMVYWTSFPGSLRGDPCDLLNAVNGPSVDELASVVASAPGTELAREPSFVLVGGRSAQHVKVTVREDLGCDPGYFYSWPDLTGGPLFPTIGVGDSIEVWIVEVEAKRLFFGAVTTPEADAELEQEIQGIIGSIRFRQLLPD